MFIFCHGEPFPCYYNIFVETKHSSYRISGLVYVITSVLFQGKFSATRDPTASSLPIVMPVSDCEAFRIANTIFYGFTVTSSSYLFLLRVWAVFYHVKWVQAIFSFLWIFLVGSTVTVPFAVTGTRILPTNYCIDTAVKSYASAAPITSTVFDTLVFLAVSFAVFSADSQAPKHVSSIIRHFCNTEGMSCLSRAVFQGGQFYYL
jgi:hypothetical protein